MSARSAVPVTRLAVLAHPQQSYAEAALARLRESAARRRIEIVELQESPGALSDRPCQVVVSVGGDGTLLAAVRHAYPADIPVWGVNVGQLGFLTTSGIDEIEAHVGRLAEGRYWVESRAMIEAVIECGKGFETRLVALNDIVVHRQVPGGGLMMLDCELDDRFLATYEADGLIVSTPTGSTGYTLSAGGSILSPTLPAFIITPICAHSFSSRSLVVDDSSVLVVRPRLKSEGEVAFATADGQAVATLSNCAVRTVERGDSSMIRSTGGSAGASPSRPHRGEDGPDFCKVILRKAGRSAGLVRFDEVFFSDVLRDKLGWAEGAPGNRTE
jgi:NAD+ kinase